MNAASRVDPRAAASARRTALLAGSSGLIGRELLLQMLNSAQVREVHVLVRRPLAGVALHPKMQLHTVDFTRLPRMPVIDDAFIALGTTLKVAGSEAAFRQIDFNFVVNTARAARAAGATRVGVVSALGADSASRVFYNRVKGDMQAAVAGLGFESVVFAQPSLLVGNRAALGQPERVGEVWATRLLGPVMGLVPKGIRPIQAHDVARSLLHAVGEGQGGVRLLTSGAMQP